MQHIYKALQTLDPQNADHWTSEGLPRIDVLSALAGAELTREQVTKAAPMFTRKHNVTPESMPAPVVKEAVKADGSNERSPEGAGVADDKSQTAEDSARADARAKVQALEQDMILLQEDEIALRNKMDQLRRAHGIACDLLAQLEPVESGAAKIRAYQDSQKALRAAKVEAVTNVRKLGVTAEMLQGRSPLDTAMKRKR